MLADDVSLQIYMAEVHSCCPFYVYQYDEYTFVLCHFEENVTQILNISMIFIETAKARIQNKNKISYLHCPILHT